MTTQPKIANRLPEILEIYKASATVYNAIGNGSLNKLPLTLSSEIDRAVSKAVLVAILLSMFTEEDIKTLNMKAVVDDLLTLVLHDTEAAHTT